MHIAPQNTVVCALMHCRTHGDFLKGTLSYGNCSKLSRFYFNLKKKHNLSFKKFMFQVYEKLFRFIISSSRISYYGTFSLINIMIVL